MAYEQHRTCTLARVPRRREHRLFFPMWLLAAMVASTCLFVGLGSASAESVAVLGFSGKQAGKARGVILQQLRGSYKIVSIAQWTKARKRLGLKGTSAATVARVSKELGLKAVVAGSVRRLRRQWRLTLVVRDGATGKVVGRRAKVMRNPARVAGVARALSGGVRALVRRAQGAPADGAGPSEVEPPAAPPEESEISRPPRESPSPGPVPVRVSPPDTDSEGPEEEPPSPSDGADSETGTLQVAHFGGAGEGGTAEESSAGARRPRRFRGSPWGYLLLGVRLNLASRFFQMRIDEACDRVGRSEIKFSTPTHLDVGAELQFFPAAPAVDSWAANLGLEGTFHYALTLEVASSYDAQEVQSQAYGFSAGLLYRVALGTADRGMILMPRVGFLRESFWLDGQGNDVVAPFTYDAVYVAVSAYVPLATRYVGLELGAGYNGVVGIGEEAQRAYNSPSQVPTSHGVHLNAGFSGKIFEGLLWRIGFEMDGFFTTFRGKGRGFGSEPTTVCLDGEECANRVGCYDGERLEGQPEPNPVVGGILTKPPARDLFWRINFQLSYRFGWRAGSSRYGSTDWDAPSTTEGATEPQ